MTEAELKLYDVAHPYPPDASERTSPSLLFLHQARRRLVATPIGRTPASRRRLATTPPVSRNNRGAAPAGCVSDVLVGHFLAMRASRRLLDPVTYVEAGHILGVTASSVRRRVIAGQLRTWRSRQKHRTLSRADVEALASRTYLYTRHATDADSHWVTTEGGVSQSCRWATRGKSLGTGALAYRHLAEQPLAACHCVGSTRYPLGPPSSMHMVLPSLSLNQAARPIPGMDATTPFHSTPGISSYTSKDTPLACSCPTSASTSLTCH
jgi:hypothetical protein